jgi:hypothetical protein
MSVDFQTSFIYNNLDYQCWEAGMLNLLPSLLNTSECDVASLMFWWHLASAMF